jgi:hypothetical protein
MYVCCARVGVRTLYSLSKAGSAAGVAIIAETPGISVATARRIISIYSFGWMLQLSKEAIDSACCYQVNFPVAYRLRMQN